MKPFNFDEEEDELGPDGLDMSPSPAAPPAMNPQIQDYISKKFNLGDYSNENRSKLVAEGEQYNFGDRLSAALGGVAAGLGGGDSLSGMMKVKESQKAQRAQKLAEFDRGRANTIQDYSLERQAGADQRADELLKKEADVASDESKMADQIARKMGYSGPPLTADQFKRHSPSYQKMYEIEQRKLDRQEARDERRFQHGVKATERKEEKEAKLQTPFGMANTEDDAKQLKGAFEAKSNFDSKLSEMIALRKKHKGGAVMNREDVARGKQLSKDLLLEYKNMAKLGVLSQADENIINAIIPADPLEYNSPLAAMQGQDPTLNRLEKFKGDAEKDFQTKVGTRTRAGIGNIAKQPPTSGGDKVQMLDPKGRPKMVDKKHVEAALAAGGTLVDGPMVGGR